jgi:hypothetical protein
MKMLNLAHENLLFMTMTGRLITDVKKKYIDCI